MKISFFNKVFDKNPTENIDFYDYLEFVKNGKWANSVLDYRAGRMEKKYLPAVAPAGIFKERNTKGLIEHSGIINIDIDAKENPDIDLLSMRDELAADPFTQGMHISVGGGGLSLYVKINPKKHYESFISLEKYYANKYHIVIDKKAKDIPRLRFVSHDMECFVNKKSSKWTQYIDKAKQQPRNFNNYIVSSSDFDFVMDQITRGNYNIADDYQDWISIGFAFAAEFGEQGRQYFHDISKISNKYDFTKTDKKYNNLLKSKNQGVTIKTFYWLAKNAGCQIKSQRTAKIENVAKMRIKQVGKSGGIKNKIDAAKSTEQYLKEFENIEGADVDEIINQINSLSDYDINSEKSDTQSLIDSIIQFVNQKKIKFNVITGKLEIDYKPLTDNDINSLYIDLLEIDDSLKRQLFDTVINSNRVKKYNPFIDFINKNKNYKTNGEINQILDCISENMTIGNEIVNNYKDVYVKKWMLSIMASIHGTYSLMILVLTGKQGTQKTNFFRNFLPKELASYYAESKLDAGKDDEILMTQKLLIIDDEFGGKSKQEAKKLKDLSSKQYFSIRRPYGKYPEDIQRIAVLGGTSNEDEILNDPTGNRRIIPLKVIDIDFDKYYKIDKTALFIELYNEWQKDKDGWMLTPNEVKWLNKSTTKHEQEVEELQLVEQFFEKDESRTGLFTTTKIKVYLESITRQKLNLYKLGQNLKKLGYVKKPKKLNGKLTDCWNVSALDYIPTHEVDNNVF